MTHGLLMISERKTQAVEVPAPILWITGLSGSGKSTLATAVVQALRARRATPLLLDGDAVREAFEPEQSNVDHGAAQRLKRAWRLARLARFAASQGVPVVVATISLVHSVQAWNRSGSAPYAEVLLSADIQVLRLRNPALYGDDMRHPPRHVVGLDIKAQYPLEPELIIEQCFDRQYLHEQVQQTLALWRGLTESQQAA